MSLPELPESGALRVLVIAASTSLLALVFGLVLEIRAKRWRSTVLCAVALLGAGLTGFLARSFPQVHIWITFGVLFLLVYNASQSRGVSAAAQILAALTWAIAQICARILY